MAHTMRDVLSAWEDFRPVADEYRELDSERVLDDTRAEGAQLFCLKRGKVVRLVSDWDRDRALADLGQED
jgi:hypothetical protein